MSMNVGRYRFTWRSTLQDTTEYSRLSEATWKKWAPRQNAFKREIKRLLALEEPTHVKTDLSEEERRKPTSSQW